MFSDSPWIQAFFTMSMIIITFGMVFDYFRTHWGPFFPFRKAAAPLSATSALSVGAKGKGAYKDPVVDSTFKGYPQTCGPTRRSCIKLQNWNIFQHDLHFPIAVLKKRTLDTNIAWMREFCERHDIHLCPHGKTTMSFELFQKQMKEGQCWGITLATATQAKMTADNDVGVKRIIIANQVMNAVDLDTLHSMKSQYPSVRVYFLVDSIDQLTTIERWHAQMRNTQHLNAGAASPSSSADGNAKVHRKYFDVLLEIGMDKGRTGVRTVEGAIAIARKIKHSESCSLVGIETYEGLWATGKSIDDTAFVEALISEKVVPVLEACQEQGFFETKAGDLLLTAGGSSVFDLAAMQISKVRWDFQKKYTGTTVQPILRSGCYITHDHGTYEMYAKEIEVRMSTPPTSSSSASVHSSPPTIATAADATKVPACGLQPALEVWASVQSTPETGLVILNAGKRDVSYDAGFPSPVYVVKMNAQTAFPRTGNGKAPNKTAKLINVYKKSDWKIEKLNDQHAYLKSAAAINLQVGDLVCLGISHPCSTFEKWRWIPVVDDNYTVVDAVFTHLT